MPSLDETFDALTTHLRHPESLNPAKSDPFFYFVHDPAETLAVKQKLAIWSSMLRNEGWVIDHVSLSKLIWEIVDASRRWDEWLTLEPEADPAQVHRPRHPRPGRRLLGDHHDPRYPLVAGGVDFLQESDRFQVLPAAVDVGRPLAVAP